MELVVVGFVVALTIVVILGLLFAFGKWLKEKDRLMPGLATFAVHGRGSSASVRPRQR